jgi:hypothetical protein
MVGTWCPVHLRKFISNQADFLLRGSPFSGGLIQICKCLYIKKWAHDAQEEIVKPNGFIQSQRLQEGFVEKRDRAHFKTPS